MKQTITIPLKDLQMLAEALKKAENIIQSLGIGERTTPQDPKRKNRQDKYKKLLDEGGRMKKSQMV